MEKKWSWGVNAFAILVLSFGIFFLIDDIKMRNLSLMGTTFITVIPGLLAMGIMLRRQMARRICMAYFWGVGIFAIFASCFKAINGKAIFSITIILLAITWYLTRPKVKELFK